jgi:putative transferase (TIGR04331 family)
MSRTHIHLITTADIRTWAFNVPVIFLGEWCKKPYLEKIWHNMNYIVADPYGLDSDLKKKDQKICKTYKDDISSILYKTLNDYHGVNYSNRSWEILLGHWVNFYVDTTYNRIKVLLSCIEQYDVKSITVVDDGVGKIPMTTDDFIRGTVNDEWNSHIYADIVKLHKNIHIPIQVIGFSKVSNILRKSSSQQTKTSNIKKILYRMYRKISYKSISDNDAVVVDSCMPILKSSLLELRLFQVPQKYRTKHTKYTFKIDSDLRYKLSDNVRIKSNDEIHNVLNELIFKMIPACYLEGFSRITEEANSSLWPKNPKFVYTDYAFSNELFKFWISNKVDNGTLYVVGQHGNNYGTNLYIENNTIEEKTSDIFLTWGNWNKSLSNGHTAAFVLKTYGAKHWNYKRKGSIAFIVKSQGFCVHTWDVCKDHLIYLSSQRKIVSLLDESVIRNLIVRLHSEEVLFGWEEARMWKELNITVDSGVSKYNNFLKGIRLCVFSYDCTGALENLSLNMPTIVYLNDGIESLTQEAKIGYKLLIDSGIAYTDPESMARKINKIHDNLDDWWYCEEVQEAKSKFCQMYAKYSNRPVKDFLEMIKKINV